jgi:hypothetical protein
MPLNYKPNDLNKQAQIGMIKTVKTPNGGSDWGLDPTTAKTVWYGSKMRTLGFQLGLSNAEKDDFDIVVRHSDFTSTVTGAVVAGTTYKVKNVSPDETPSFNSFDILTLTHVTKGE